MNLNNKYLAIGLSITAVVVVGYQIFFNKPDTSVARPATQPGVVSPAPVSGPVHDVPITASERPVVSQPVNEGNEDGLNVDFNSPILLKRIERDMAEPYIPSDLVQQFGAPIFTRKVVEKPVLATAQPERVIEFNLNAIVIDEKRSIAVINGKIVKVGSDVEGAVVLSIKKGLVILKLNDSEIHLSTNSRIQKINLIGGKGEK